LLKIIPRSITIVNEAGKFRKLQLKNSFLKLINAAVLLAVCVFVFIKFAWPAILQLYVETGIGNCRKIPILCVKPSYEIINPVIKKEDVFGLPYCELGEVQICAPETFKIVKQHLTKIFPGSKSYSNHASIIYLFYGNKDFFVNLFPQLTINKVIKNDYEFLNKMESSSIKEIHTLTDAFFSIMKSILTPDLGNQYEVKIARIITEEFKGFISYNTANTHNYFDCNILTKDGVFLKIYIKDKEKELDLDKVIAILASIKKVN